MLSDFSADLGSILQQRVLCTGALVHQEWHSSIKFLEVAIHTVKQNKMEAHSVIHPTLAFLRRPSWAAWMASFFSKHFVLSSGDNFSISERNFQDWAILRFQFVLITGHCVPKSNGAAGLPSVLLHEVHFRADFLPLRFLGLLFLTFSCWAPPPQDAHEAPPPAAPAGSALCSASGVNSHQFELHLHEPQRKPQPRDEKPLPFFRQIQVSGLHHFPSPWRTPNISCQPVILVTNSFNFCWSLFLLHFWRKILLNTKFKVDCLLSSLLAYMVSEEKSDLILILVPLQVRCLFPVAFFRLFSLNFIFCSSNIIYLCVDVLEFACIVFSELPGFVVSYLSSNFSAIITSNISCFRFSVSSPFTIPITSILHLLWLSYSSYFVLVLSFFFPFALIWGSF